MMDDSNKEAGDGVPTFQPNEIEPKYGEELEVKGKLHQDDNHEPYPKRIQEGGDTTIKDLAVVCHENLMENEKRLSSEGPMAVSESKAVNVNEDVDCCAINESKVITEDHFGEDDRLVEKDSSVSAVDTESDEKNHPLSVMCNGQDFVKKDDITKHTCPEHLDEQLPQAENKESFHDLQLRKLCANGRDEHTIPQGCYNGKTDVKDDTGNSEATEIRLVQPLERVLSKSMMDDSNKEVGGGVPTFQPNEIEPKYGEELEVKGKLHQDDNHELYPKRIQEGGDTTIKDLAVVCHENLMENEKRLSSEGPMAVSESKAVNVNEDVDCCAINESKVIKEDHFGEDDRLVEKDSSVSAVDTESDEKNHPLSVMCNGQDFVKKDDITKHTCPEHLDEQLPQAENKQLFNDLQLRKLCANGRDKHAIPEKGPHSSSNMEAKCNEPAVKENAENDICTAAKATKNESTCSLDGSNARNCIPQTNNRVASGNKNKAMASFNLRSDDHKHWDTKSVQMVDNTTDKELSLHLSHSPKCEQIQLEAEVTKEMDQRSGKTNEGLEECNGRVVIPFIGIDISREDIVLPHDSQSQDCNCKKADVSTGKVSLLDIPENKPWAFGGWSDDRCPTPTMDEKPYESITSSDPQSYPSSTFLTQKCLNGSSVTGKDKVPIEQKPCQKSTVNGDSDPHHGLHPDLELRTLRVFQSIDQFLSKSELKIIHKKSAPVSSSSVQKVHTESSAHFLISPFKSKIEEVLGVGLQLKKTDSSVRQQYFEGTEKSQESSSGQGYCHPHHSLSSTSTLGAIISNVDQDTATSQANLSHEPCSSSLRPVMAVKPSKSDESQADSLSKDRQIDHSVMSKFAKNKQPKIPLVTSPTRTTMLLEKQRECYKGTSEGINNNAQEASKLLEKSSWSPHVGDRKSKYDKDTLVCQDPLYQNKRRDSSKYNKISSSSLPVQTFGCIKSSSQLVNGKHGFSTNSSADRVGQTAAESLDMDQNDCLSASTSLVDYKDDNNIDDSLYLGPDSSLSCTVYNTSQKRSHSFLEQISQRCIQEDPTEASMEQECLIFSEKIKQLLKRSKKGSIHQPESHGKLNLPCPSPMTVHFSGLEEQEETMDHLDAPSLFGQKIKVHMSDREDLEATTEGEKALHSKKSSEGTGTPIEDAGVSTVTAECAELYEEKMNNICAVRKVPSTRKHMERGCPRSEPSKYFDFCDQMKREMDNSFRSNLNSVVKKSRKTKYRFYILETSDDVFFEETKVQLEAEGHTAVQPSEFFLDKGTSSSLLIILRNEDIAEHICEVPHLLALKKSPGVQFAGIDETDDVVNLTHQELFTKGGFIMLDGAALEPLSLCDMKKMSEILQGLSKTGKWKWMLHYRDSRRLKENARLSQEAKEKKQLLNWCQEAGIIEVLPYHECDLMSRDQPDYLTCLVRLQVQNISARYTVFITDTATDSKFESNGIITTTFNSFLTCSPSEAFSA
nr:probable GPI-anchored adhesin-like protein PGA55 isoform X1 [Labrus bergylta]